MDPNDRISHIRGLLRHRGDADYDQEILRQLAELERDVLAVLAAVLRQDRIPASITVASRAT